MQEYDRMRTIFRIFKSDVKGLWVIEPAIALREASEKLNCKSHVILNA